MQTYKIDSFDELKAVSKKIFIQDARIFLLNGSLGAGKTSFVSNFIKENLMSATENFEDLGVMSPTFSILNQYTAGGRFIIHADLYRLDKDSFDEEELLWSLEDADYAFIEWSSKMPSLESFVKDRKAWSLNFTLSEEGHRKIIARRL